MGTDYNDLDIQAADDVPGATWANQLRENQEALIEPPSMRFMSPSTMGWLSGFGSPHNGTPLTSAEYLTWTPVTFVSYKGGEGSSGTTGGLDHSWEMWQRDVASTTAAGEPWRDSAGDTSTGTFTDNTLTMTRTNSFSPPTAGVYRIDVGVTISGVALPVGIYVEARVLHSNVTPERFTYVQAPAADQIFGANENTRPVISASRLEKFDASDTFKVEVRSNYQAASTVYVSAIVTAQRIARGF